MTDRSQQNRRELLRAYLLRTLDEDARARVGIRLEEDPAWRKDLEIERAALAALDALPDESPPPGLAESAIARAAEAGKRKPAFSLRIVWLPAVAAALMLIVIAPFYLQARQARLNMLARNHLQQIGLAMRMYSNESEGERYPPLAPQEDLWIFDVQALYPKYLNDLTVLASPRMPGYRQRVSELAALQEQEPIDWERVNRIAAESYTYLGYLVTGPGDIRTLARERTQLARAGFEDVEPIGDSERIFRLREGIERFLLTDINNPGASSRAQSTILLLMERPAPPTERTDSLALYLDGHVERLNSNSALLREADVRSILRSER